jgi:hypothetical protein
MTGYSRSPRLLKGALVVADVARPLSSLVIFQYNPDTVRRTLRAQTPEGGTATGEALRLAGPPEESISMQIEIDATDQLESGAPAAAALGLHPTLARLELLLYPTAAHQIANQVLALAGIIELVPPEAPLTLLVWGPMRVLPVRLTSFTINEEAFDTRLNPVRATVDLDLTVLTYQDLGLTSVGGALHMAHHLAKEAVAAVGGIRDLSAVGSVTAGVSAAGGSGP